MSVADLQKKYDEISAIREAAKNNYSITNHEKREIAKKFERARQELKAASSAAMAKQKQPPKVSVDF